MESTSEQLEEKFIDLLAKQRTIENGFSKASQKQNGAFLTNDSTIIDAVLKVVPNTKVIFKKSIHSK